MKEIQLTQGKVALVDDADYNWLMQWNWFAIKSKKTYYVARHEKANDKLILMHRVLMQTPDNMLCDHEDHNGLNCQRYNIRNCNSKQNTTNRTGHGSSKYLGVSVTKTGKFRARIMNDGKAIHLGYFNKEENAAIAYDTRAAYYFGEFANLNFK